MERKKWFLGYFETNNIKTKEIKLLETIDKKEFRESIKRVYDYEYFLKLEVFVKYNYEDFQFSISKLIQYSKENKNIETKSMESHQTNIQRTFMNVVNSHRLLTDHIKHNLSTYINKEDDDYTFISKIASHFYDNNKGYKIIDNLRNYCQHKNLIPIEIIRRDYDGEIQIIINKEVLEEDSKLNKKLKIELANEEHLFFIFLIEEWFNSINKIYEYYFDLISKYSENDANKLLLYFKGVDDKFKLYLMGGLNEENIDQYIELPKECSNTIISRKETQEFNKNILFINSFKE